MFQMIQRTLKDQTPLYAFVAVLLLMGVVFGALMVNALTLDQQEDISKYLNNFFISLDPAAVDGQASFWPIAVLQLKWVGLIWLFGLSVIGLPGILILDFLKGVLIGFTVGCMVGQFSWKGLLLALVSVAPHNLIVIPVLLVSSAAAVKFSIGIIRSRVLLSRPGKLTEPFLSYTGLIVSMSLILLAVACFETWVSPVMMSWVSPMLGQA
ncbi:stage II sporulation protein M [Paenibacillus pinistramenti]|uniref:stage II sporulation protein M n=1 Tax=Paenibacillus pinistramenti TaxID=1768003 RepID=UPI001107DFFA|nr:stage II sporulation protein M [Paenibacillus pinistramenti]